MDDHIEEVDGPTVFRLPTELLRRKSLESEVQAHTHRELPSMKRAATTTAASSRSHSHRFAEPDGMQAMTSAVGSYWPVPSSSSLSSGRRPSLLEVYERSRVRRTIPEDTISLNSDPLGADISIVEPDSPEGTDFSRSLEINMKNLVGDAVGNMSISPYSRDIVLAARKGLFIIDLENPLEVPRFLPQGGTWDVADVQWNPHPSRSQYIVSTSSEKMLIWNLGLTGKTSIEHILRSHYRAITDFNWHTTESDVVASTGIDSWIFVWDLRIPRKPVFGLSAFKAAGTQVKWNRQDGNFLASSHGNEVLIWDRRKGSLPMTRISAHNSKIYGIDWSHHLWNEIVTCSLDKTIKTWDTNDCQEPKSCIQTDYPVWRARNLPFGQGVLSLPQRGETRLEMFARGETPTLVETFDGHSDVVKEFVWRKSPQDEFQLITWSKDRTLRFWPVSHEVMQKVGHSPEIIRGRSQLRFGREPTISHRKPPEVKELPPMISAPVGNRGILAEVRAGGPPRSLNLITHPHIGSSARATIAEGTSPLTSPSGAPIDTRTKPIPLGGMTRNRGGTMSRGTVTGKSVAHMDAFTWLSNVKVGNKRGGSSGGGSAEPDSNSSSRLNSRSRPPSGSRGESESVKHRSPSRSRGAEDRKDENTQSLQDEITGVLSKLASYKIKPEKVDLTKKRTITLGLHGPWGERSSVFMRVTFTFPSRYPQAGHPEGTPNVEIERSPLISLRDRAHILKRLRVIRERKRPCLEACLRFLLFGEEDQEGGRALSIDSESSDEEHEATRGGKDLTVSLLRNHKNLAEPRTSQGTFGPHGELICFFRAPPRIVRNVLRGLSESTSMGALNEEQQQPTSQTSQTYLDTQQQQGNQSQQSRLFQSPALVSDAIRRLSLAAKDRVNTPIDPRKPDGDLNILRTMTNLLTVSQHGIRRESMTSGQVTKSYSVLPTRRSNVFMMDTTNVSGPDSTVAVSYVFHAVSLAEVCEVNAKVAREGGRYDHERIFKTVQSLFRVREKGDEGRVADNTFACDALATGIIMMLYSDLSKSKDIQMLAMLSVLILQTPHGSTKPRTVPLLTHHHHPLGVPLARAPPIKTGGFDYFSLARSINNMPSPLSPAWPSVGFAGTPSPIGGPPAVAAAAPSVASSNSSRGSWSSLFNTGSMRQFMNGVQDTLKDGLITPSTEMAIAAPGVSAMEAAQVLAKIAEKAPLFNLSEGAVGRSGFGPGSVRRRVRKESSSMHSVATTGSTATSGSGGGASSVMSRSWGEGGQGQQHVPRSLSVSFSSAGHKRSLMRLKDASQHFNEKQLVVFEPPVIEEESSQPLFSAKVVQQMRRHVLIYAEVLFRWKLFNKRLELLKAVDKPGVRMERDERQHRIGVVRMCARQDCRMLLEAKAHACAHCGTPAPRPACTICRLPVKGLSHSCLKCYHVSHISCWRNLAVPICPTGCGCCCMATVDGMFTRPPTRLGLSPQTSILLLAGAATR